MKRKRLWYSVGVAIVAIVVVAVVATRSPSRLFSPDTPGVSTPEASLRDLPAKYLYLGSEWRDVSIIRGDSVTEVNVGTVYAGGALRLGLIQAARTATDIHMDLYANEEHVRSLSFPGAPTWQDHRVALTDPIWQGQQCRLLFSSRERFYLGPCDLVKTANAPQAPNVLIVLIDALRQDHLGCYGYARATSPRIDRLAAESFVFENLVVHSSWTRPSVVSLLTSCYPGTHGANDRHTALRAGSPTLAACFERQHYETQAFMTNPLCVPTWNIGAEFNRVIDLVLRNAAENDDGKFVDAVIESLPNLAGRPWFIYLHLMGPHNPYTPPKPYDTMFASGDASEVQKMLDQYDGEIAYTDAQVGRLLDKLKQLGMYDRTIVVLLSDHGEQFYEHGEEGHGKSLHAEEMRVPLIIKPPAELSEAHRIKGLIEEVDIAPTLLGLADVEADARFEGLRVPLEHLEYDDEGENLILYGVPKPGEKTVGVPRRFGYASLLLQDLNMHMIRTNRLKLVENLKDETAQWFDLVRDPAELHPLDQEPAGGAELRRHATRMSARVAQGLNILVTGDGQECAVVTGVLRGPDVKARNVFFPAGCADVEQEDGKIRFEVRLAEGRRFAPGADDWFDTVEQQGALLTLNVSPDARISLELWGDSEPLDAERVLWGQRQEHLPLDAKVIPLDLSADPRRFDPLLLPRRFAVYVWYVPSPERIEDGALPERTLDALRSLGYVR